MTGDPRGQTATIGIVLLFGVVAVGSMSILLVAGETVSDAEQSVATDHVTQGFVELSSELETATYSSDTAKTLDMAVGERGAVRKENTGWIRINSSRFTENISLGAVVYESENGETVAYQAGGVWRGTGRETQMVSAPPVHYEDYTLTLPVNSVVGDSEISSGRLTVEHNRTKPYDNTSVQNEIVTLEIKSEYYVGWKKYFTSATNDAVLKDVDHDANTVTVELGRPDLDGAFDNGISVSDEVTNLGGDSFDDDDIVEGVQLSEFDPVIDDIVNDTDVSENRVGPVDGSEETLTNGTYYADEVDLSSSDLSFDLSDGSATLVVAGDVMIDDESSLTVENWSQPDGTDNHLKVYLTGNLTVGGEACVAPCDEDTIDAEQLQVYGNSEMTAKFEEGSGTYFEGALYAPSNDPNEIDCSGEYAQICIHSNSEIVGGIVAGSVHSQSASNWFEYDPDLEHAELDGAPDGYLLPPKITYLNVVVHEIIVENAQ